MASQNKHHASSVSSTLEVNEIDDFVRRHSGTTIALEMSASRTHSSKRQEDTLEHFYYLSRTNGELRAELLFYRQCFANAERFKHKVEKQAQDLLHECIIALVDKVDLENIRSISIDMTNGLEELQVRHDQAFQIFKSFIVPRDSPENPLPSV